MSRQTGSVTEPSAGRGQEPGAHGRRIMLKPGEDGRRYATHRLGEHVDRPAREIERQYIEAERSSAKHMTDDQLVHVGYGEHDDARPRERQAEPEQGAGFGPVETEAKRHR